MINRFRMEEIMAVSKVLSIEIGSQTTKLCVMDNQKKSPHIYQCFVFDTPENTIDDGYIRDKNTYAAALKKVIADNKIKHNDVVFTISSSKIANREVLIPMVKPNRIQAVVNAGAQDYFPVDVSDYTVSYTILEKINTEEEKKYKLLLLAAPNTLIKNYYSFAEMMKLHVVSLDYAGNSFFQVANRQVREGVHIAACIGEETTIIDVIENQKLVLQRIVPYGIKAVTETLLEHEVFQKKTEKEAFDLLCQENLINAWLDNGKTGEESAAGLSQDQAVYEQIIQQIRGKEDITESLQYLVGNINRVLDYYHAKFPGKRVDTIYLGGSGARMKGMTHLFRNELGLETKRIEELFGVTFHKNIDMKSLCTTELISCIGAPIKPMGFVLSDVAARNDKKNTMLIMEAVLGLSCALAVVLMVTSGLKLKAAREENDVLKNQIRKKEYVKEDYKEYTRVAGVCQNISSLYAMTRNQNEYLNDFIKELEERLPATMKVTSFNSSEGSVSMNLLGTDKISVAELILQLKEMERVAEVTIPSVVENEDENGLKSVNFSVNIQYAELKEETGE